MNSNLIVGQSGGPTSVINASLYGVVKEAHENKEINKIYGMLNGIEGLLNRRMIDFDELINSPSFEQLQYTPSAFLGSCRYKLPESFDDSTYRKIFEIFTEHEIGYFFYIGGNDSMDTVDKLSKYAAQINYEIRIIGVPKTIDNDLVITDHTPGFASAAKFVATSVREICLDVEGYKKPSVTIIEIMGRNAGWLTAASVLARNYHEDNPCLIYLPEIIFNMEKFIEDVRAQLKLRTNVVVAVSEGIRLGDDRFVCELLDTAGTDNFGHKKLSGCSKALDFEIRKHLGIKSRAVEFNVVQRCAAHGGSLTDIEEAVMSGRKSVEAALKGETGKMLAFIRKENKPYRMELESVDVCDVCNKEKKFPKEWITNNETDISSEFLDYIEPLIQGEPQVKTRGGLPHYVKLTKNSSSDEVKMVL